MIQYQSVFRRNKFRLHLASRVIALGERTLVMGVLNVTPDSFSDGGLYHDSDPAIERGLAIARAGADILDVGAESTRPGSLPISIEEELRRILPVLKGLRGKLRIPISVDTSRAEVAEAVAEAGAEMLNDVSALRRDARLAEVARRRRMPLVLMHMRGEPRTMQTKAFARHVMMDVQRGLQRAAETALRAGVRKQQILLDPGIGFGKNDRQNYELLAGLPELARLGFPLVVGTSRKGFIGRTLGGVRATERLWGTAATVTASILGGAHIVRVHDVAEMVQVVRVSDALLRPDLELPKQER